MLLYSFQFSNLWVRKCHRLFEGMGGYDSIEVARWEIFLCARLEKYLVEIEESGLVFFFRFKIS